MTIHHIGNVLPEKRHQGDSENSTVLLKFKPEVTAEQRQSVRDSLRALPSQIPAIQSIVTGETVFSPLGHGFDEGAAFLVSYLRQVVDQVVL